MANVISTICTVIGILLCISSIRTRKKIRINHIALTLGIALLFATYLMQLYAYSMRLDIKKREMIQVMEEENVYQLITIEANEENTEYYFYYTTEKNGVEGAEPKTISSKDVFIIESNKCKPMVIETLTAYEYEITEFERWWLDDRYLESLDTKTLESYEIYVPEDTLKREYNLN